jgi:hypothetical protein
MYHSGILPESFLRDPASKMRCSTAVLRAILVRNGEVFTYCARKWKLCHKSLGAGAHELWREPYPAVNPAATLNEQRKAQGLPAMGSKRTGESEKPEDDEIGLRLRATSWENLFDCLHKAGTQIKSEGNFWAAVQELERQFDYLTPEQRKAKGIE